MSMPRRLCEGAFGGLTLPASNPNAQKFRTTRVFHSCATLWEAIVCSRNRSKAMRATRIHGSSFPTAEIGTAICPWLSISRVFTALTKPLWVTTTGGKQCADQSVFERGLHGAYRTLLPWLGWRA